MACNLVLDYSQMDHTSEVVCLCHYRPAASRCELFWDTNACEGLTCMTLPILRFQKMAYTTVT